MPQVATNRLALSALVLVSAFSLAGCTRISMSTMTNGGTQIGSASGVNASDFSGMDIMLAQMMIPHHQQAIYMSALARSRALRPEVKALASKISAEQGPEIEQMRSWLKAANAPTDMGHKMSMDGMLSDAEIKRLSNASDAEFAELTLLKQ